MKIAIITTGDEIMSGNVVDTNSSWIADKCWMLGHPVVWHGGVGDFADAIGDACKLASERAEVVFVTGGLGATIDDITVESAAKAFGKKMILHDDLWKGIQNFFKKIGRECTENNKRQAFLPEGAKALGNPIGSAPGVQVKLGHATFFFLPGVPKELYQMFNDSILPWLSQDANGKIYLQKFLRCFGIPEASFDERLKGIDLGDVRMSFRVTFPEVKIKLIVRSSEHAPSEVPSLSRDEVEGFGVAKLKIERVEGEIRKRIGDYIFGENEESLEVVVGNLLKNNNKKLSVAESCTGGHISNLLTNVNGASAFFDRGIVCYSNQSKVQVLGVKEETLKKFGAVSEECAKEMAAQVQKLSGSHFGLAVTGIAGPTGGTKEKPLGTVHIALATDDGIEHVHYCHVGRDRLSFKVLVAYEALDMVRRKLL